MVTLDKMYHAAFILKEVARRTDLIYAPNLSNDAEIYLKTENLQVTGSFKLRGAYYKISQLTEEQKKAVETAFVCMLALPTIVIRDKFGEIIPKKGREETFVNLVLKQYELFNQGYFTLDDLKECLLQETGIKFER